MGEVSLADIAAVTKDSDGAFSGNGLWIFALLLLLFGSNGGFFGGNALSQTDLQRAVDLNSIQEGQATINANVQRTAYEQIAATKDAAYNNLSEIRDNGSLITSGNANIINNLMSMQQQMQNCCCEQKSMILENRYLDAQNTASINANTTAAMQKVLDTIQAEKIASLENEVNSLRTQTMFCGVPKISPYMYNVVPTYGCGCSMA